MQSEWTDAARSAKQNGAEEDKRTALEIKRSSWHAGMAADITQPPPGSPAAWQDRRRSSRPASGRFSSGNALDTPNIPQLVTPKRGSSRASMRQSSPSRGKSSSSSSKNHVSGGGNLAVPSLQTIRSVSGSALGPDMSSSHLHGENEQEEEEEEEEAAAAAAAQQQQQHLTPPSNPFNFTPTFVTPGTPSSSGPSRAGQRANQRRGHHYKHSSVSMNFFQEPEERAPLSIPVSLAVPTFKEYYQSMTQPQIIKLGWCMLRMLVATIIYAIGSPFHCVASLAHLLAYETIVSTSIACVEVLANFEVWNRSSLRLPFALKRVEVLVAFGLSAVLLFIGGDIVSHTIQTIAAGGGGAHSHSHSHNHGDHAESLSEELTTTKVRNHILLLLTAVASILPTAWKQWNSNSLAVATLAISCTVLVAPLLPSQLVSTADALLTPVIACTMIYVGYTSSKVLSAMLAMSFGGKDRSTEIKEMVSSDPNVVQVKDISLWQVHHDLLLASMHITMSGNAADERRVREKAARAIKEAVAVKDVNWETTIEISRVQTDDF